MISGLVSYLLPAGGSNQGVGDEDRLSGDDNLESESGSGSSTPMPGGIQAPETAHTLSRPSSLPPTLRRSKTTSSSPTLYEHPDISRSTRSLKPPPLPPITPLSPIYEPKDFDNDINTPIVSSPTPTSVQASACSLRERTTPVTALGSHAFIKRPLNRTVSQKSATSLHSEACGAPKLPPLNLRPYFNPAGTLVTVSSPQKSPPSTQTFYTPQSVTTPRTPSKFGFLEHPHKYSAIYEDASSERTDSFVTAWSDITEPGPGIMTKHDMPSTADVVWHGSAPAAAEEQEVTVRHSFDGDADRASVSSASVCSDGSSTIGEETGEDVWEEARRDAEGEAIIMKRWEKTDIGIGKDPQEFLQAKEGGLTVTTHDRQAHVLFWLGFVAPWCWLVGGWVVPRKTSSKTADPEEQIQQTKGKQPEVQEKAVCEESGGYLDGLKKLVLPHPSPRASSSTMLSTSSLTTLHQEPQQLAPWVSRCRIAAVAGGILFALATLITVAVVLVVRS